MYTSTMFRRYARRLLASVALLLLLPNTTACSLSELKIIHVEANPLVTSVPAAAAVAIPAPASAAETDATQSPVENAEPVVPSSAKAAPEAIDKQAEKTDADILAGYLVAGKSRSHIDGLAPAFKAQLVEFFAAMPDDIRASTSILSGYRSVEHQKILWDRAVKKYGSDAAAAVWVARPGRSHHNMGLAVDLSYADPKAIAWAHENAGKSDLAFPMSWENWHIEPRSSRRR
ncbi:M15 family metallopeptidase [Rhizobium leguminosarum]|uniref:M15 family metallopeptidase n=1 Tax=Rhizobium leguminosarum TaxID=384 RepID=UPI0021BBBF37|nr:M15 family metallopeptidase [Rhizobium leguminosarum]